MFLLKTEGFKKSHLIIHQILRICKYLQKPNWKPYSFSVTDIILTSSDIPLKLRKNLLERTEKLIRTINE